jgi:hypothetical protein
MGDNIEHDGERQPLPTDPVLIDARLREVERQEKEDKKQQQEYNRKQLRFNSRLVWFTGLLVVTSAVSDLLMLRQASIAKLSADAAKTAAQAASDTLSNIKTRGAETKTQIDRLIAQQQRTADAMEQSLSRAKESMEASERQSKAALDAGIEQSNMDRRAWIAPVTAGLIGDFSVGKSAAIGIQYTNVGKEPAFDVRPVYRFQHLPLSTFTDNTFNSMIEADDICKGVPTAPGADVIYPQEPAGYKLIFGLPATFITEDLMNGNNLLIFRMCFAYTSIGKTHHTSLCYFYRAGTTTANQWNICTAGNHAN